MIPLPFIIWLLCVGIAALVIGFCIRYIDHDTSIVSLKEGFSTNPIVITSCPAATTTYVTSAGDTNCCDGDIVDGQCNGNLLCSLSPNPAKGLDTCADWIMKEWKKRSDTFCAPASMPYYFGTMNRRQGSVEGCSASPCSPDGTTPRDAMKPKCKIYQTSIDEYGKTDSCFNQRALDAMATPIPAATKQVVVSRGSLPAILSASYIPPNGSSVVPLTCYDWDRMVIYFNAVDPTGETVKSTVQNKDKDVQFCGASKAYYVDGTLSISDAIGVPNAPPPRVPTGEDPRCYVNGVKLGNQRGEKVEYTSDECNKLGGIINPFGGANFCTFPGADISKIGPGASDVMSKIYNYICSSEPEVKKMLQIMPYDNDKNYQGSDKVIFNGSIYKLKPGSGGSGYPPNAANTIWDLVRKN